MSAFGFADDLERLDLPECFVDVSADGRCQDLESLDHAVRIDDETSPRIHSGIFIVNAVNGADPTAGIGQHREGNTAVNHFRQFMIVPHFVDEHAVDADGEDFDTQFFEFFVFFSNC